jgi:hypothetical protein
MIAPDIASRPAMDAAPRFQAVASSQSASGAIHSAENERAASAIGTKSSTR